MIWASRTFTRDGWFHVQDQFEAAYDEAGEPVDWMLCRVEAPARTTIFVGLPDAAMLEAYEGFRACPQPGGMVRPLLLMGDMRAFDDLFNRRRETRDRTD